MFGAVGEDSGHNTPQVQHILNSETLHWPDSYKEQRFQSNYLGYNTIIFIMHVLLPESELQPGQEGKGRACWEGHS